MPSTSDGGGDVPPQFVPGERRKMKEASSPKESRSVDDLASDIKREYHEEQVKRPSDENSIGEPDEGRVSERAPAESLSEAISNKFRGKADEGFETSKHVESSESREAAPSDDKRKTLDENPTQNEAQRLAIQSKDCTQDPETRPEKMDAKNPKEDCKPLRFYEVKMYTPTIRGEEIKTEDALRDYTDRELPGMKHLPNFDKLISDATAHMQLRELVGDRHELKLSEIRSLSEQTDLPFRTTRHHVANEGRPDLYRLAEKAITKTEAESIVDSIHSKIGAPLSHSDVEKKLREDGVLEHLRSLPSYQQDNEMVHKYFKFVDVLGEGGVMRDMARRVGVSEGTCITWAKGILPLHVKRAINTSDSPPALELRAAKDGHQDSTRETPPTGRIRMTCPEIKGVPVESDTHLKNIITKEYRGMMDMPGFDKMLHEACVHQQIMKRLQGRESLKNGEIRKIAAELNVKAGTIEVWTNKGATPRLYFHINRSVSTSEASKQLETIHQRNNGAITLEEYERRMQNYYLRGKELSATFNERESAIAGMYFRFLERYQLGGPLAHAAKQAGVAPSTATGWLEGKQPRRVRIASGIPKEDSKPNHLWLPLRFRDGRYPEDFIQVPESIKSYKDVLSVLRQLKPIGNEYLTELHARLGRRSIEEEIMYLLGAYMSDGSSFNKTTIARSFGIRLAQTYPWSKDFGDGLCQALGVCGVYAHRTDNTAAKTAYMKTETGLREINQSEKFNWAGENSPLPHWIYHSCLGYTDAISKEKQPASADWIITSPLRMRKAMLQGLGDGDGSASVQGNYIGISSNYNNEFIEKLLQSFGLQTRHTDRDVMTTGMAEAKKAAQIPPFRFASSRLEACERIVKRIDALRSVRDSPLNQEETDFILDLKRKGMTAWEANEAFFDKFHTAINNAVVERIFQERF